MKSNLKTERLPTPWCGGCLLNTVLILVSNITQQLGMDKSNTVAVSGIGCTARSTGFLNFDSVNGLHGRAIPIAEGLKLSLPKTNVFIFSGDGDLTGIGGNHLIHAARRNTNITIICAVNQTYGMTGGQMSPTTEKGTNTLTSPKGAPYSPINTQGLIMSNPKYFFGRSTTAHISHLQEVLKAGFKHQGFSFIEILTPCYSNMGRRIGFNSFKDMLEEYKTKYSIQKNKEQLLNTELGYIKK